MSPGYVLLIGFWGVHIPFGLLGTTALGFSTAPAQREQAKTQIATTMI